MVLFGTKPEAHVRAEEVSVSRRDGRSRFVLVTPEGATPIRLPVPGEHMIPNAVAAAAVGWVMGIPLGAIAGAVAGAVVSPGRMEVFETTDGLRVVNDAYNANPASMAAALRAARWMAGQGRCIAVLGTMAELGPVSAEEHARVGELVARLGVHGLVVVGREAHLIAAEAEREGVEPQRIVECLGVEEAAGAARSMARPGDLVLVKASRVARLERVAEALRSPVEAVDGAVP